MKHLKHLDFQPNHQGLLRDVKVLDISRLVAGNMLSLQLADMGADVIKVETSDKGDSLRDWKEKGRSLFWQYMGRNKRSIDLNLRDAKQLSIFKEILKDADVLIENFRPGVLEKMGFSQEVLETDYRQLIVVRISGFGQTGPMKNQPGFGTLVEGMSGFAARNGFADREPVLPPIALADMITGLYGTSAVLGALHARNKGYCNGQTIDLALLDAMGSFLGTDAQAAWLNGEVKPRCGSGSNQSAPRNVYQTKDNKWVSISGSMQSMAERILWLIGGDELLKDERFLSNSLRVQNRSILDEKLSAWVKKYQQKDFLELCLENNITAAPIYDALDFLNDEHISERETLVQMSDEEGEEMIVYTPVARFSHLPQTIRRAAPKVVGQDTAEILKEYNFERE